MFTRLVDLNHLEPKQELKQEKELKCDKIFNEEEPKNEFPDVLEENSLDLLKTLLSKHKNLENEEFTTSDPDNLESDIPEKEPETRVVFNMPEPKAFFSQTEVKPIEGKLTIAPSSTVSVLYNKIVEGLIHIDHEGIAETTIFLDGDAFATSKMHGSKIVLTEFSTAPKVFNIQFVGTPESLNFFEPHAGALLNALQSQNFRFEVHRLDLSLLSKKDKYAIPKVEQRSDKEGKM